MRDTNAGIDLKIFANRCCSYTTPPSTIPPPIAEPAALIDAVTNTWNLLRMLDTARSSWNMNHRTHIRRSVDVSRNLLGDHRIARDTTRIDSHDRRQLLDKCQIITFSSAEARGIWIRSDVHKVTDKFFSRLDSLRSWRSMSSFCNDFLKLVVRFLFAALLKFEC